jgi:mono/diheme cytochrome c family protein
MLSTSRVVWFVICGAVVAACEAELVDDGLGGGDGAGAGGAAASGLPCDVAQVLVACSGCHAGDRPSGGVRTTSRADLLAASPDFPAQTVAERCVLRMRSTTDPMPPSGPLSETAIQVVEAWVQAGMPEGDCQGSGGGGPVELTCTSNQHWTLGNEESPDMNPGQACISCHASGIEEEGPLFAFGGTVFPGLHDEDDCYGSTPAGTTVVVTDAVGRVFQVPVRPRGNFYQEATTISFPIRAEVRRGDQVLAMKDPVGTGDCNTCHSAEGAEGAPGRILGP